MHQNIEENKGWMLYNGMLAFQLDNSCPQFAVAKLRKTGLDVGFTTHARSLPKEKNFMEVKDLKTSPKWRKTSVSGMYACITSLILKFAERQSSSLRLDDLWAKFVKGDR